MKKLSKLLLVAGSFLCSANAAVIVQDVHQAKDCPEGLTIQSSTKDGWVSFVVRIDPDKVENSLLYAGKISAVCHLELRLEKERIGYVQVQSRAEKTETVFTFSISELAAKSSRLDLNTHFYETAEKNAWEATLGGGRRMNISLAGFLPDK